MMFDDEFGEGTKNRWGRPLDRKPKTEPKIPKLFFNSFFFQIVSKENSERRKSFKKRVLFSVFGLPVPSIQGMLFLFIRIENRK